MARKKKDPIEEQTKEFLAKNETQQDQQPTAEDVLLGTPKPKRTKRLGGAGTGKQPAAQPLIDAPGDERTKNFMQEQAEEDRSVVVAGILQKGAKALVDHTKRLVTAVAYLARTTDQEVERVVFEDIANVASGISAACRKCLREHATARKSAPNAQPSASAAKA